MAFSFLKTKKSCAFFVLWIVLEFGSLCFFLVLFLVLLFENSCAFFVLWIVLGVWSFVLFSCAFSGAPF